MNQPDLFAPLPPCNHPVSQRIWRGGKLVCGRCGKVLRDINED